MAETIDVSKLSIQQLDQFQKQLANEVNMLQESLGRLKQVQGSFINSETSLEQLKGLEPRKPILVPLTGSLYVPGTLVNNSQVLVDVGTGYYVGKSVDDAKKYFEKKIEFLSKQLEQLQPILQQKNMMREDVVDVLQQKYAIQMQVQKAAAAGNAQAAVQAK
jgi:prefoldin alpha subunit